MYSINGASRRQQNGFGFSPMGGARSAPSCGKSPGAGATSRYRVGSSVGWHPLAGKGRGGAQADGRAVLSAANLSVTAMKSSVHRAIHAVQLGRRCSQPTRRRCRRSRINFYSVDQCGCRPSPCATCCPWPMLRTLFIPASPWPLPKTRRQAQSLPFARSAPIFRWKNMHKSGQRGYVCQTGARGGDSPQNHRVCY